MTEYELLLLDRKQVIQATNKKYDLEHNAYISFSGGKDSTILHYLFDMALPNNQIPRVFIDTGIEFNLTKEFVLGLAENDDRFVIIKPSVPIKKMLEKYGYPFKSKEHSQKLSQYQARYNMTDNLMAYVHPELAKKKMNPMFICPIALRYQFNKSFPLKVSHLCCKKMKKEPARKYEKENNRPVVITGMRISEGGGKEHPCLAAS